MVSYVVGAKAMKLDAWMRVFHLRNFKYIRFHKKEKEEIVLQRKYT